MQNLLKQLKQNFEVRQFESYKNCMGERVYSMIINNEYFTVKRETDNYKLYELGHYKNNYIEVERHMNKQDIINFIMKG